MPTAFEERSVALIVTFAEIGKGDAGPRV